MPLDGLSEERWHNQEGSEVGRERGGGREREREREREKKKKERERERDR